MSAYRKNRAIQEFMYTSSRKWRELYPNFRAHIDGDKTVAYDMVKDYVKIPAQYHYLSNVRELTVDMILALPQTFVIKGVLGNQGTRVFCIERLENGLYREIPNRFHRIFNAKELVHYVIKNIREMEYSKGNTVIIEQFIGDSNIASDYKVYVVNGVAKLIGVFTRRKHNDYAVYYDIHWNKIPLHEMFQDPKELDYAWGPAEDLPDETTRANLLSTAEALAKHHQAMFCRYDFYCFNGEIYFGEITPICGNLNKYPLRAKPVDILLG